MIPNQLNYIRHFQKAPAAVIAFSSAIIAIMLGFIDEGAYNFYWMKDWGNWFVLSFYWGAIFGFLYLISGIILKRVTVYIRMLPVLLPTLFSLIIMVYKSF